MARLLSGLLLSLVAMTAVAGDDVPVLSAYPGCAYELLGNVRAVQGRRPDGTSEDVTLRAASYDRAFARLSAEAHALGANAVALNANEAAFYVKGGRRSSRPVYIALRGGALRLQDPAHCSIAVTQPDAMLARALRGEAEDVVIDIPPAPIR